MGKHVPDFRISSQRPDEIADILVDSGWFFAILVGYERQSDGTFKKNNKGRHVLMRDYDKQCFVDAFGPKSGSNLVQRALSMIVRGAVNDRLLSQLEHSVMSRLTQRYGAGLLTFDSLPSNLKHLQQRN